MTAPREQEPGTGPLLRLAKRGMTTREIAAELGISQSSVSRKLRQLAEARRRKLWFGAMYATLTACAIAIAVSVVALAISSGAWLDNRLTC